MFGIRQTLKRDLHLQTAREWVITKIYEKLPTTKLDRARKIQKKEKGDVVGIQNMKSCIATVLFSAKLNETKKKQQKIAEELELYEKHIYALCLL